MAGFEQQQGMNLPLGRDPQSVRKRIEVLEQLLERAFVIPGIRMPVGLDAIIGLVPVAGDVLAAVMGLYLVWEARNLGLRKRTILRMLGNIGFDTLMGSVPVAGDVLDFVFRSNRRNLKLLQKHLDKHHPATALIDG